MVNKDMTMLITSVTKARELSQAIYSLLAAYRAVYCDAVHLVSRFSCAYEPMSTNEAELRVPYTSFMWKT